MGLWHDSNVYFRDFAYNARRLRMANGNISDVPASTFAEYVPDPQHLLDALSAGASQAPSPSHPTEDEDSHAPPESVPSFSSEAVSAFPGLRPALAHRLYSHRLHVRAKAKLQRDRLLSGPLVDIYVGDSRRHWSLHRNLLCHHSELIESELEADGKKKHYKLELPGQDPAGFQLLVKWLYQGRLDDVSDMADANQKYEYAVSCFKLYLLCDRFDMPQLKNVAMDQYRKGLNEAQLVPDAEEINDIYRKSPARSPFRRLMTRIAARQIMDPDNDRDVETYRDCFADNPDFAVELINAIKLGTGGMLFDDPTFGNECEFHDHEAGPNCHIKGKGRIKQALKAPARPRVPRSASSEAPAKSDPTPLLRRPPPTSPDPQPLPLQARRQDGGNAGPLRRRLTSPASSTVETSTENATAAPPSPKQQKDKFRRVTPPQKHQPSPALDEAATLPAATAPETAQDGHLQSSGGESRQPPANPASHDDTMDDAGKAAIEDTSPRRGIWEWARVGSGRLNIMGMIPHPEWKGPVMTGKAANSAVNGLLDGGKVIEETQDDFSIPSSMATEPENEELRDATAAAKLEGLGISTSTVDPALFSQTKKSSDDLVRDASGDTPSPTAVRKGEDSSEEEGHDDNNEASPPSTPSPPPRKNRELNDDAQAPKAPNGTPSPHRIPKYKIALASSILSPRKTSVT